MYRDLLFLTYEVPDPVYGFLASVLKKFPEIREIMRKNFGDEFVSGSCSMKARHSRLIALIKEKGADWAFAAGTGYIVDLWAFFIKNPIFRNYRFTEEQRDRILREREERRDAWKQKIREEAEAWERRWKESQEQKRSQWSKQREQSRHQEKQPSRSVRNSAYYRGVLGVGPGASKAEIRKAYQRMAIRCHPDKNPGDAQASERFKKVQEAYEFFELG